MNGIVVIWNKFIFPSESLESFHVSENFFPERTIEPLNFPHFGFVSGKMVFDVMIYNFLKFLADKLSVVKLLMVPTESSSMFIAPATEFSVCKHKPFA